MASGTFDGPVYTPPIERSGAGDRRGEGQMSAYNLLTLMLPILQQQYQFGQTLQPQQQSIVQSLLNMNTPEGLNTADAGYRAQQMGGATDQGNLYAGLLGSQGVSQSGKAGATLYAQNNATKNANAFSQNLRSPKNLFSMGQQSLGMIQNAQNPDMSGFLNTLSGVYGKPNPVAKPNMFGQILGAAAGAYAGNPAAFAGLFGSGQGGGAPINGQGMYM